LDDPVLISRWQFAFTIVYHYLFPALTMGLAGLVFVLKSIYMRKREEIYNKSARFWGKIFAITKSGATKMLAQKKPVKNTAPAKANRKPTSLRGPAVSDC
jgi:hypothetical protein